MLRLGIVDCDTSHVYAFAQRLNHAGIDQGQWVDGAQVVAAYVGTSEIHGPERIAEFVAKLQATGVELVDRPEDLIGGVDGVLVTSNQGAMHRERATPFIEAGLPVFVDKPFTSSVEDARALVALAEHHGGPLISASALRFATEVVALRADDSLGAIRGADVYTSAHLHEANPGLFHYGVHGVEMLYTLLGVGCREVACTFEETGEVVVGRWADGRVGVVRGLRGATVGYGMTLYGEQGIRHETVGTEAVYRNLLAAIVPVLAGEQPSSISAEELVEVVAFQEAALASRQTGGRPVEIRV
ncbi:MAG: Gfo/Idh/MocA family protein [Thermomicrobiales bacterium]